MTRFLVTWLFLQVDGSGFGIIFFRVGIVCFKKSSTFAVAFGRTEG